MTVFVIVGGLLIAGALLFVLPPLLRRGGGGGVSRDSINVAVYRDQLGELEADLRAGTLARDQYDKARGEIEARLLEDVGAGEAPAPGPRTARAAAAALGVALPLVALAVYFLVGNPQALAPQHAGAEHGLSAQQVEMLVERLAARLRDSPEDAEGWVMLGRSYVVLGRFGDASRAYASAAARLPGNAQVLADYADALGMAQGRSLLGEPEKIIARALAADPDNIKALALAGTAAFDRKNYAQAAGHWERILALVPQESEMARSVQTSVAEARALGGRSPEQAQAPAPARSGVSGVVRLAPEIAGKAAPTDTVFIFARAAEGPRMPLAVVRKQVRDLPAAFHLDDAQAMTPEAKLSKFPRVVIGARVSKTAGAAPQAGDLQGASGPVANDAAGVTVVIDAVVR